MRIRRVRLASACSNCRAQRPFGAAGEFAFGRLTINQVATAGSQIVGRSRAVGSLLLSNYKEDFDTLLVIADESIRSDHHRGGDALRVGRPASEEPGTFESRW